MDAFLLELGHVLDQRGHVDGDHVPLNGKHCKPSVTSMQWGRHDAQAHRHDTLYRNKQREKTRPRVPPGTAVNQQHPLWYPSVTGRDLLLGHKVTLLGGEMGRGSGEGCGSV